MVKGNKKPYNLRHEFSQFEKIEVFLCEQSTAQFSLEFLPVTIECDSSDKRKLKITNTTNGETIYLLSDEIVFRWHNLDYDGISRSALGVENLSNNSTKPVAVPFLEMAALYNDIFLWIKFDDEMERGNTSVINVRDIPILYALIDGVVKNKFEFRQYIETQQKTISYQTLLKNIENDRFLEIDESIPESKDVQKASIWAKGWSDKSVLISIVLFGVVCFAVLLVLILIGVIN